MTFRMDNSLTGDTMELPSPDELGHSVLLFNGQVIEHVLFSDVTNTATIGSGEVFKPGLEFAQYVIRRLEEESKAKGGE